MRSSDTIPYTDLEKNSSKKIQFWFDSVKEAQDFKYLISDLKLVSKKQKEDMECILAESLQFSKHKTKYRKGFYWKIEDIDKMTTLDQIVNSSEQIPKLVGWQHQDFIISANGLPKLTVEATEHEITWNNVAQRIPRLIQSVNCGIPSIIFQKIGERSTEKNLGWFLQTLVNASKIYGIPCIAILFDNNSRRNAEKKLSKIMVSLLDFLWNNNKKSLEEFEKLLKEIQNENEKFAKKWYDPKKLLDAKWLEITDYEVKVVPGVRPDASMWKTKGTGGLDPYPGLVAMADFLFCRTGPNKTDRKKSLTVKFRNIKKDFWWFKKYPTELYLQMLIDPEYRIADKVEYMDCND